MTPYYRFKWPFMAWWDNDDFTRFLTDYGEIHGLNSDRRWMIQELVRLVADVPGDTAECGAWKGAGSFLIVRMNRAASDHRMHHIVDSFEGLSVPVEADGDYWKGGDLASPEAELLSNLSEFGDMFVVHKGWIPDVLQDIDPKPFAFIHLDLDLYAPTRDCLEFFYPLMSPGAVLLCDDYGNTLCPGVTRACDEYLSEKPEKMIAMAAGSGFFIKGTVTQPALYPLPHDDTGG